MQIGEKIHALRKNKDLTLEEVARYIGVTKSTVRKWETGYIESMKTDKVKGLAEILGTTLAYLMSDDSIPAYKNIEPMPEMRRVPILGVIACGEPAYASEENAEGWAELDKRILADFALRCSGDSMINARIFDDDLVFVRRQPTVENGEIAAVLINDEATLKRVYKYRNRLELRPENPLYPVLEFEGEEMENIQILGKAVAFLSAVK